MYAAQNLGYDDPNCEQDLSKISVATQPWVVNTKTVSHYFDANKFVENDGSLPYNQGVPRTGFFSHENDRIP